MPEDVVLDSSALLALVRAERGSEMVATLLPQALMSTVNFAEALMVLERNGVPLVAAESSLAALALRVVPADVATARGAAEIAAAAGRRHGLSLGDCFCLATAGLLGLSAVTADRAWSRLKVGVRVTVVR